MESKRLAFDPLRLSLTIKIYLCRKLCYYHYNFPVEIQFWEKIIVGNQQLMREIRLEDTLLREKGKEGADKLKEGLKLGYQKRSDVFQSSNQRFDYYIPERVKICDIQNILTSWLQRLALPSWKMFRLLFYSIYLTLANSVNTSIILDLTVKYF
ncbi:hypothetical protein ACTXT7_003600 [Hymenolepis weldensis]